MCACSSTWLFKDSERNDHIHVCLSIYFKVTKTTILSVATLVSLTCNYQFGTHTQCKCSHQFSSRWYLCARKSPYALRPFSHKFSQRCMRNSSSVSLIDDGPLWSFQGRSSSYSSFHASLLQAFYGMMSLPAGNVSSSSTLQILRDLQMPAEM